MPKLKKMSYSPINMKLFKNNPYQMDRRPLKYIAKFTTNSYKPNQSALPIITNYKQIFYLRIKNIKNKTERIESKLYDSFIQNVKKLIRKKIQLVVSGMNQISAMEFKMIRINYLAFFKNEGTSIDENMFSLENLVKLDLLSLSFKANSHYRYQYHTNQLNVISSKALVSILQLQKSQFKCYSAAFLEMEQWLDYKYQKEFEAIITIVSFIQLKFKLSNFCKRQSIASATEKLAYSNEELSQRDDTSHQNIKKFKFKFCEIAFLAKRSQYSNKKLQINTVKLKQLFAKLVIKCEKHILLKEIFKYNLSFKLVRKYLESSLGQTTKMEGDKLLMENLYLIQWIQMKGQCRFSKIYNIVTGIKISESEFLYHENQTFHQMQLISVQRFRLYTRAVQMLIKLNSPQTITFYHFCLSLKSFIEPAKLQSVTHSNDASLQCTVMLGAVEGIPVCSAVSEARFKDVDVYKMLKIFIQQNATNTRMNLIVNSTDDFCGFQREFNRRLLIHLQKIHIFLITDYKTFKAQRWIEYLIRRRLKTHAQHLTKDNFKQLISQLVLMYWNENISRILQPLFTQ